MDVTEQRRWLGATFLLAVMIITATFMTFPILKDHVQTDVLGFSSSVAERDDVTDHDEGVFTVLFREKVFSTR